MKLMTNVILCRFKAQGDCRNKKPAEVKVIAKFFNLCGAGTWYATEYNPEDRCFFGLAVLHEAELGYFSLDEMESIKLPFGLTIERDLHFGYDTTLKEVMMKHKVYSEEIYG